MFFLLGSLFYSTSLVDIQASFWPLLLAKAKRPLHVSVNRIALLITHTAIWEAAIESPDEGSCHRNCLGLMKI